MDAGPQYVKEEAVSQTTTTLPPDTGSMSNIQASEDEKPATSSLVTANTVYQTLLCNEVKKPCPTYFWFCKDFRMQLKRELNLKANEELPISFSDIARRTGAKWRAMTDEEKEPYFKQAVEDRKRYQKEIALASTAIKPASPTHSSTNLPPPVPVNIIHVKQEDGVPGTSQLCFPESPDQVKMEASEDEKPATSSQVTANTVDQTLCCNEVKKPCSPFLLFCKDFRMQLKSGLKVNKRLMISFSDTSRRCGAKWRAMTFEEKQPYYEQAVEDKKKYWTEIAYIKEQAVSQTTTTLPPVTTRPVRRPQSPSGPAKQRLRPRGSPRSSSGPAKQGRTPQGSPRSSSGPAKQGRTPQGSPRSSSGPAKQGRTPQGRFRSSSGPAKQRQRPRGRLRSSCSITQRAHGSDAPTVNQKPHCNVVKRRCSPYLLFREVFRRQVMAKEPTISFSDVTKGARARWQMMHRMQKQRYYKQAEEEKKKHKDETECTLQSSSTAIKPASPTHPNTNQPPPVPVSIIHIKQEDGVPGTSQLCFPESPVQVKMEYVKEEAVSQTTTMLPPDTGSMSNIQTSEDEKPATSSLVTANTVSLPRTWMPQRPATSGPAEQGPRPVGRPRLYSGPADPVRKPRDKPRSSGSITPRAQGGDGPTVDRKLRYNIVKQCCSPYLLFFKDFRRELEMELMAKEPTKEPTILFSDAAKKAGLKWRAMSYEEKLPYHQQVEEEKKKHEAKLEEIKQLQKKHTEEETIRSQSKINSAYRAIQPASPTHPRTRLAIPRLLLPRTNQPPPVPVSIVRLPSDCQEQDGVPGTSQLCSPKSPDGDKMKESGQLKQKGENDGKKVKEEAQLFVLTFACATSSPCPKPPSVSTAPVPVATSSLCLQVPSVSTAPVPVATSSLCPKPPSVNTTPVPVKLIRVPSPLGEGEDDTEMETSTPVFPQMIPNLLEGVSDEGSVGASYLSLPSRPDSCVSMSSSSSEGSGDKETCHKVVERKRRDVLKASFLRLRDEVPKLNPQDSASKMAIYLRLREEFPALIPRDGPTKMAILTTAVDYIQSLKGEEERLNAETRLEERQNRRLRRALKAMEAASESL